MSLPEYLEEITAYLSEHGIFENPEAAIILGSGLGGFSERIQEPVEIGYDKIPHFPKTTVVGHSGSLIRGKVKGRDIVAFSGRFHHYEGHPFERTALPVYVAKALGAKKLIISNAAGSINFNFKVGDLMLINDVMRLSTTASPRGHATHGYNHYDAVDRAHSIAAGLGIPVQRGTYMYAKGPNYESKAEIRAFRVMGADAVGMSTAPELFEASRLGLPAVAISLISNMAAGVTQGKLSHDEVKQAGDMRKADFANLVEGLVEQL